MTNLPQIIQPSERVDRIIALGPLAKSLNFESKFDEHPRDRGRPITAPRTDK
jgi:hypothetical protein